MNSNSDNIINSFDKMKRAEAPGFFYAGIRAKMERGIKAESAAFSLRPVFVTAVLFVFLLMNIFMLTGMSKQTGHENASPESGARSFAQEYHFNVQTLGR